MGEHTVTFWLKLGGLALGLVSIFVYILWWGVKKFLAIKFLKKDFITGDDSKHPSNRISVFNLFWDLGADRTAWQIIHGLDIVDWEKKEFKISNTQRMRNIIEKLGGYHVFVQYLLQKYDSQGMDKNMVNAFKICEELQRTYDHLLTVRTDLMSQFEWDEKDIQQLGKSVERYFMYALGDMMGIPFREMQMIANIPKIKNAAMYYYRIYRQSGKEPEAIFRTAEDIATTLASSMGKSVGFLVGFSVGQYISSWNIFAGALDFDRNGVVDGIERVIFSLFLGFVSSVISGKFFTAVKKWWDTRRLRKLQKEFKKSCELLACKCLAEEDIFNTCLQNMFKPVSYWQKRLDALKEVKKENTSAHYLEKVLLDYASGEIRSILKHTSREAKKFLKYIYKLSKKGKYDDIGRVFYWHGTILFNGIEDRVTHEIQEMNNILLEMKKEYDILKAKGVLSVE